MRGPNHRRQHGRGRGQQLAQMLEQELEQEGFDDVEEAEAQAGGRHRGAGGRHRAAEAFGDATPPRAGESAVLIQNAKLSSRRAGGASATQIGRRLISWNWRIQTWLSSQKCCAEQQIRAFEIGR